MVGNEKLDEMQPTWQHRPVFAIQQQYSLYVTPSLWLAEKMWHNTNSWRELLCHIGNFILRESDVLLRNSLQIPIAVK